MYNIDSNNKTKYITGGAFLWAAIIEIFLFSYIVHPVFEAKNNTDSYTLSAKVELNESNKDGSIQYSPVYYYNVEGSEFACHTSFSTSIKPSYKQTKIYYNSKEPSKCISEYEYKFMSKIAYIAAPVSVIISLLIGLFLIISAFNKSAKIKKLAQSGQLIKNIPCRIIPSNIALNGIKGYYIELEYEGLKFKSEAKFNIDARKSTADLLIDPLNTKNYFIDFDILQ